MNREQVKYSEVTYSGKVQGVGFRYATRKVALEFEVSGTVRNLPDGRVMIEVEGQAGEVDGFLNELEDRQAVFIRNTERHDHWREPKFRGFEIVS